MTKKIWFSHIAVEVLGEETENVWLESVSNEEYGKKIMLDHKISRNLVDEKTQKLIHK